MGLDHRGAVVKEVVARVVAQLVAVGLVAVDVGARTVGMGAQLVRWQAPGVAVAAVGVKAREG